AMGARGRRLGIVTPNTRSGRDPHGERLACFRIDLESLRRCTVGGLRRPDPESAVTECDPAAVDRFSLDLPNDRAILRAHQERFVRIDLVKNPQALSNELEIV